MPASTVENQNAMVPRLYRGTGEMFVRRVSPICDLANRKHPFCARGSEKIDVAGDRPAGGYSCAPTAVTTFPPIPPSSWNQAVRPALPGPTASLS